MLGGKWRQSWGRSTPEMPLSREDTGPQRHAGQPPWLWPVIHYLPLVRESTFPLELSAKFCEFVIIFFLRERMFLAFISFSKTFTSFPHPPLYQERARISGPLCFQKTKERHFLLFHLPCQQPSTYPSSQCLKGRGAIPAFYLSAQWSGAARWHQSCYPCMHTGPCTAHGQC